ncbi:MAG: response regulator [Chloroflexi bacterium]|nr:response regulator [Chloroflexota bacterium]
MNAATIILVVEDNPINRKMLRVALESEGYAVLAAEDGQSAVELMAGHPVDLVLVDLLLPDVDGIDLAERLRSMPGGAETPIVAITGLAPKLEQARSSRVGFTDYLFKPIEPSRLVQRVQAYLRPRRPTPQEPGRGRRVLAVDDDPLHLKLLKIHLGQAGFDVTLAGDGAGALEQARRSPPDAILGDLLMPHLDGVRLCLAIRQDAQLAHVPVVLMSAAYTEAAERHLAESVGANALVLTTPDYDQVIAALFACLGQPAPDLSAREQPEMPVEEYTHRVVRQLERQASLVTGLTRRVAQLEAELTILAGFSKSLMGAWSVDHVLGETLHRCLDALGASRGIAYLLGSDGGLAVQSQVGYAGADDRTLVEFFGYADLLHRAMEEGEPVEVPSDAVPGQRTRELLARAEARLIVITPLLLGKTRLGALVMAAADREVGEDWAAFARVIGSQIAQALGLAQAVADVRASEERLHALNAALEQRVAERTAQLEATNKELEAFSYSVSHDLRAPLRAIDGFSQALLEDYADRLDAEGRDYLRRVRAGSQRMAQLIDDLLKLSRVSRWELRRETVDLSALARAIAAELRQAQPERRVDFAIAEGLTVVGDAHLLRIMLENLLGNAWKFTAEHGTARIELGTEQRDGERVYFVRDDGAGFEMAYAGKLFGAFQRLHAMTEFEGTGIGLATVQRIVHRHGGRIWAEAAVEQGATFFFTLQPGQTGKEAT